MKIRMTMKRVTMMIRMPMDKVMTMIRTRMKVTEIINLMIVRVIAIKVNKRTTTRLGKPTTTELTQRWKVTALHRRTAIHPAPKMRVYRQATAGSEVGRMMHARIKWRTCWT
jgi:hypothetical protein